MQLDGLASADKIGNGDGSGIFVASHDVADEKIAAPETGFVFVNHATKQKSVAHEFFVILRKQVDGITNDINSPVSGEFENQIASGAGDDHRFTDGSAALRNHDIDFQWS